MHPNMRGKFGLLSLPCQRSHLPAIQSTNIIYRILLDGNFPYSCHCCQVSLTTQFLMPTAKIKQETTKKQQLRKLSVQQLHRVGPSAACLWLSSDQLRFAAWLQIPIWSLNIILQINKARLHGEWLKCSHRGMGLYISETRPSVTLTSSFSPDITWPFALNYKLEI